MKLDMQKVVISIDSHRIINNISLHVDEKEIIGLIGPNGSGKTTLLRSVYRMLRPEAGLITSGSDDIWKLSSREAAKRTGAVIQESPGDFDFTVQEIVEMGRTPHKKIFEPDNQQDEEIVYDALNQVDMFGMRNRQFNTLSGGEKQRVLVARALAQEPKLLVLDEPTNHLDIGHQLEVLALVRNIKITTLITLHDLNLAASFCDRLYLLSEGQIVASGTPIEVLNPKMIRQVYHVCSEISVRPENGKLSIIFIPQNDHQNLNLHLTP